MDRTESMPTDEFISVVVVCYNEEKNIAGCLESLLLQEYNFNSYEVIVVDGNSEDKTQEIVRQYESRHTNLRLIINHDRTIASNRNVGVNNSKGRLVAFTDADCRVPHGWIRLLVGSYKALKENDNLVIAVGGANLPFPDDNGYPTAIAIASNTFIGSLNSTQARRFSRARAVPSLAALNVLYEKDKLQEVSGFDTSMHNICEDADINYRLRKKGYRLIYCPDLFVWHRFRPKLSLWIKNVFAYGNGRACLIKKYGLKENVLYLLPAFFIIVVFLLLLFSVNNRVLILPFLGYLALIGLVSVYECLKNKKPRIILKVFSVYLANHFAFGAGEITGLFRE
jgi:glycosyltransferase involved in cell wall biosynthesis